MERLKHPYATRDAEIELSIIIVSWNVAVLLNDCLHSIENNATEVNGLEVFVVDNASSDHSVEMIREKFPWVNLIVNQENRGFAFANNQALKYVRGEYILLLNPDTVVMPGCFSRLVSAMSQNTRCGMIGPRIMQPGNQVQKPSARRLPSLAHHLFLVAIPGGRIPLLGPCLEKLISFPYDYSLKQEVEAICGAAMMISRATLLDVGPFDETFYHCGEDVEWCYRVRKSGWQIVYEPDAEVFHYCGRSSSQDIERISINALLSIQNYFRKTRGAIVGNIYELIMRSVGVFWMLVASVLLLIGRQCSRDEFLQRLRIAKRIFLWPHDVIALAPRYLQKQKILS